MTIQASTPNRTILRLYSLGWVLGYWLIYFFVRDVFPEKALTDAAFIQEAINGTARYQPTSGYAVAVAMYGALPLPVTNALVGIFNGYVLFRLTSYVRTFRGMVLMVPILLPMILLGMQAPTKETLVFGIALFVAWRARCAKTEVGFIVWLLAIYSVYGAFAREYYLLILLCFMAYFVILKTTPVLRWLYLLPLFLILLLLPEEAYRTLGSTRDIVNFYYGFGRSIMVRTFFNNPFPADNMLHFLGNYFYATAMLNFPFLMDITPKEVLLFFNVVFYGWLAATGIKRLQGSVRLLPLLFLSHITVQMIFEPDLGSYFRHFSSIFFYLMPTFVLMENKHQLFLQNLGKNSSDSKQFLFGASR
ncbi:MAG: hypothetical protein HGA90_03160 [Alphaproteobacteria bacterium]|nr:hypothetical protein [Alphaproteobacteria bacterium]